MSSSTCGFQSLQHTSCPLIILQCLWMYWCRLNVVDNVIEICLYSVHNDAVYNPSFQSSNMVCIAAVVYVRMFGPGVLYIVYFASSNPHSQLGQCLLCILVLMSQHKCSPSPCYVKQLQTNVYLFEIFLKYYYPPPVVLRMFLCVPSRCRDQATHPLPPV